MKNILMRVSVILGLFIIVFMFSMWDGFRFNKKASIPKEAKIYRLPAPAETKKIVIKDLGNTPKPEDVKTIDEVRSQLDQENLDHTYDDDFSNDDYDSSDEMADSSLQEADQIQEFLYQDEDLVICQSYAEYCEPKEIYASKNPEQIGSCLTTYANCIDKSSTEISYPLEREDADIYIEKKLESFYQENY